MPQVKLNHARLNVVESGSGPETLVLLHGLLFSQQMFLLRLDLWSNYFGNRQYSLLIQLSLRCLH